MSAVGAGTGVAVEGAVGAGAGLGVAVGAGTGVAVGGVVGAGTDVGVAVGAGAVRGMAPSSHAASSVTVIRHDNPIITIDPVNLRAIIATA